MDPRPPTVPEGPPPSPALLVCRWVPGTLDRIRVSSRCGHVVTSTREVGRVLGSRALDHLYLRGKHLHDDHEGHAWGAFVRQSGPVPPPRPQGREEHPR